MNKDFKKNMSNNSKKYHNIKLFENKDVRVAGNDREEK